jgi:hypothetical protein
MKSRTSLPLAGRRHHQEKPNPKTHAEDIHDSRLHHQELTQRANPVHRLSQGVFLPDFLSHCVKALCYFSALLQSAVW